MEVQLVRTFFTGTDAQYRIWLRLIQEPDIQNHTVVTTEEGIRLMVRLIHKLDQLNRPMRHLTVDYLTALAQAMQSE